MSTHTTTGTLEHLDPAALDISDNVRDNPETSLGYSDLVASVRAHGVLVPVTAVRTADGKITVREGQRRVLAARETALPTVPVYITDDTTSSETARAVARITEQIVTNEARTALTESQRVKGIQQLLTLGVSVTKVAKTLTMAKTKVDAAAEVTHSAAGLAALDSGQLTIEQAAQLAEFENDRAALDYLLAAGTPGQFDHRISELRQNAPARAAHAVAVERYTAEGYRILQELPGWNDPLRKCLLNRLYDADGNPVGTDHPAHPSRNPSLWAAYLEQVEVFTNTLTGATVDESDIDWTAEDDVEPDEGYLHPRIIEESIDYQPAFYCLDIPAAGLLTSEQRIDAKRSGHAAETTDDEQQQEQARREKRKVLALNKLGAAAQDVRRAFVNKLLTRKTPPKGAATFIAAQLADHPDLLGSYRVMDTAAELLGLSEPSRIAESVATLLPGNDGRATVIILGYVLAAMENHTDKTAWRATGYRNLSKPYLAFLQSNGYELGDIEKVVTADLDADALFDSLTEDKASEQAA